MISQCEILNAGINTLKQESDALLDLAGTLADDFLQAVYLILNSKGRVAVCGMGKSGHVGRKIAATFASTGTLAYFLHPAEASHGDLGMIGKEDVLIAISNSGRTQELVPVIEYAKSINLPIIAMTHSRTSDLAKQADICLELVYSQEACPLGCAPTTSTTECLALGDALAMALLKARGFTAQDFNRYHPGGALGLRLALVDTIMHTGNAMPLVYSDASLSQTLLEITLKGLGCAGVIDEDDLLIGIITDGDFRRYMNKGGDFNLNAGEIMTREPICILPKSAASMALGLMKKYSITTLFVVNDRKPVGIVHMHDCLKLGGN